jgi:hypothetical protein
MDRLLKAVVEDPLSDEDIAYITKGKCNIMKYEQLASLNSLDEVMYPHGACILLYETEKNFGHWVALIKEPGSGKDKQKNVVEFFDSYGVAPDEELRMVPEYFRRSSGQTLDKKTGGGILTELIDASPYQIQWNQVDFQEDNKSTNTCGRWAALRVLWRAVSLDKFQNFLLNQKLTPDMYVAALTMDAFHR